MREAAEYVETPRERALRAVIHIARHIVAEVRRPVFSDEECAAFEARLEAIGVTHEPAEYAARDAVYLERRQLRAVRLVERLEDGFNAPLGVLEERVDALAELEREGW